MGTPVPWRVAWILIRRMGLTENQKEKGNPELGMPGWGYLFDLANGISYSLDLFLQVSPASINII